MIETEKLIMQYLLNVLPEAETEEIEERTFTDDDFFERVQTAEMRLIDDYVRQKMSAAEITKFEAAYLATTERREKVKTAQTFHQKLQQLQPRKIVELEPQRESWFARLFNFQTPVVGYAMAAMLVMLSVGTIYLVSERGGNNNEFALERERLSREIEENRRNLERVEAELNAKIIAKDQELAAQQNELQNQQTDSDEVTEKLLREKNALAEQLKKLKAAPETIPETQNLIVAAVLNPIGRGGEGGAPARVNLTNETKTVSLQIPLAATSTAATFDVTVRRESDRKTVTKRTGVKPRTGKRGKSLTISVPARNLTGGNYEVLIEGKTDSQTELEILPFVVDKK